LVQSISKFCGEEGGEVGLEKMGLRGGGVGEEGGVIFFGNVQSLF
jgi:hypothetical protein